MKTNKATLKAVTGRPSARQWSNKDVVRPRKHAAILRSPLLSEFGTFFHPVKVRLSKLGIPRVGITLCGEVLHRMWNIPQDAQIKLVLTRWKAPNSYKIRSIVYSRIRIGNMATEDLLLSNKLLDQLADIVAEGPVYVAVDIYESTPTDD